MERVNVQNVSKTFLIGRRKQQSMLEKALSVFSGREPLQTLRALDSVSFSVDGGEIVGIVGKNGSGKSTLLRIIAGIVEKDSGMVRTVGKVVPAIHLDAGVKDRLTMKENVRLLCTFLGYSRTETEKTFDTIADYAELSDFVNTKWYQFSDGMKQRVAVAAVVHSQPDILLLDEIFTAGDEQFKRKTMRTLLELKAGGTTIVIAGHNLSLMEEHCRRVLWIDKGVVQMEGESTKVIEAYRNSGA